MRVSDKIYYTALGGLVSFGITIACLLPFLNAPVGFDFSFLNMKTSDFFYSPKVKAQRQYSTSGSDDIKTEIERLCEKRWKTNVRMRNFCIHRFEERRD